MVNTLTQLNDARPGEILLAARVRNTLPAHVADQMLPPTDTELVWMIRNARQVSIITIAAARLALEDIIIDRPAQWEPGELALLNQRTRIYWGS